MKNSLETHFIKKIVAGGQTGVDRAALDIAIKLKIPHGGWCPKGRKAEDGVIPRYYELEETPSSIYEERTEWNARDSDGTLIIIQGIPMGGTLYTIEMAKKYNKPHLIFDLAKGQVDDFVVWIKGNGICTLNIAGPRASQTDGIYQSAFYLLERLLKSPLLHEIKSSNQNLLGKK